MCAIWQAVIDFLDAFVRDVWTKTEHKLNKYIYIFLFFLRQRITTLCLASRYFKVFYSTSAWYKPLSRISLMATHHLNMIKISQKAAAHFIAVIGAWNLQTFYGSSHNFWKRTVATSVRTMHTCMLTMGACFLTWTNIATPLLLPTHKAPQMHAW